jgi:hypothetical protein
MSDLNFAAQMKKKLDRFQGDIYRNGNLTYMGHPDGTISVPNRSGWVYVCINDSQPVEVYNKRAPLIYGLPVIVGTTPEEPWLLQIISFATTSSYSTGTVNYGVGPHADSHSFFGADPVFIEKRQLLPARVGPGNIYSGASVVGRAAVEIYQDIVWVGGSWVNILYQTVDLNSYIPVSGDSLYVLLSIAAGGIIVITPGATVTGNTPDISVAGVLPPLPAAQLALAFVRLWGDMPAVVENATYTDILDARSMLVVGSAPNNSLITNIIRTKRDGSTPDYYAPTWVGLTSAISDFDPATHGVINIPSVVIVGTEIQVDKNVRIAGAAPGPQTDSGDLLYHCALIGRFNVWDGFRMGIENAYVVGPITVGDGSTLAAKHCTFKTAGISVTVPDGSGSAAVIFDQCYMDSGTNIVESQKTAGLLTIQFNACTAYGTVAALDAYVDLQITGGYWNQRDIEKDNTNWQLTSNNAGFLTTATHEAEHAEDIRDSALVRHLPRPTVAGTTVVSVGDPAYWTETTAISGSGVPGRVAQWDTATNLTSANLIGPSANVLTLEANAAVTMTVPATGTAAILDVDNAFKGAITGGNASTGRFGSWGGSAVSGSTVVIASGASAVNSVITINYAVRENTSTDTGGGTVVLVPGGGAVNLYNDGTYSCAVTCAANGSVTVAATGARTFFVSLWMVWI